MAESIGLPAFGTLPPSDVCPLHGHVGTAMMRLGNFEAAEDHFRAAVHVAVWVLGDIPEAVRNRRRLGVMYKNIGWWKQARHELTRAGADADITGLATESLACRINLAIVLLKSAEIGRVEVLLSEISSLLPQILRPTAALLADLVRAKYLCMTGQPVKALELLEPVLTNTREQRYSREEAICFEYMGDCHLAQRDYKKALEHYSQAFQIAEATAPKGDLIPELCHRVAECVVHLGDPNAAILHCERGLRVAKDTGDRYEECATHRVLAMAHRAAGNPTKGYRVAAEGIALARAYEIPYELARALRWTGETRLQSKAREDQMIGRHHLWEARAVFDRIGLTNQVRLLDRHLGFEEEPETSVDEPGAEALSGISGLDRGALRFGIVTASPEMSQAVATIQSVAPSRIPVLIAGASGVGKELLAVALHRMSDRRKGPFVAVNCGALSPGILDSELFGHERGAFTGAISAREGIFATADHGTLFLDEIGDLPPPAQATLLRVLETGEFRPVGGDEVRTIDVRIVAATNADLENLVVRGIFRRDLYYRLEGVCVTVPPLAEREEDIRALFRFFFAKALAAAGKRLTVADDVEPMLCAYGWPGNVRELKNEIARVVAMAGTGSVIGCDAFLPKLKGRSPTALRQARDRHGAEAEERDRIIEALRAHRGNKADAARSLGGMKRTTLLYKIDRLGIRPEEYQTKEG